ncbi:ABC transporter permease [Terriglobus roseus]|uniref:Duplicated orphan permease n=1 Tax=Terriglobus roseus TaxID=392734 RepID=A0A1G7KZU4_9BACT|nr:ABC transporter permease [Terriglobus roseus]SDF42594.1 duplicated orphan permease [Terriglobus roseus]
MGWLSQLFSRRRRYNDLSVSVQEHLEEKIDELMEEGMSRKDAEHAARKQFGNVLLTEQRGREAWQWQSVELFFADIRYAARQLWKSRGITVVVVLMLALGIGAATAVFSVAYGVLVNPFPYRDVKELATPRLCSPEDTRCFWDDYTPSEFLEIQQKTDIFQGVTASTVGNVTLTGDGEAQQIRGNYITANTFDVLGVQPMLGRSPNDADVSADHEEVAVLSNRYWLSHFGGSQAVVGKVITVDGHARTVIGVMPPRFLWRGADVYLPVAITPVQEIEGHSRLTLVGRVRPGVTDVQAAGELQPLFNDFVKQDPHRHPKNLRIGGLMPFAEMFQSGLAGTLYLLLGAVLVLLLIACVNVSSLLLARAVRREHEFVLRAAIGASRLRLFRQVIVESLLLMAISVPMAILFAYGGLNAMLHLVPEGTIPDEALIALNVPVLLVSIGMAVFSVLVFGVSPAWHSANPRLAAALTSVRSTGSHAHRRLLNGFVVAEIALSLALMTLAGLMMRSMISVEKVPVLFQPEHTLMMRVPLSPQRYPKDEDKIRFFSELQKQIQNVPGVKAVTLDAELPFLWGYGSRIQLGSQPFQRNDYSNLHMVTPEYLAMSGLRMMEGHFIDEREISVHAHDAVVTQDFVTHYFPAGNAVGQTFKMVDASRADKELTENTFTIVGIIQNLPIHPGYRENYPHMFIPYTVAPVMDTLVIATNLPAENLLQPVRKVVAAMDKDQPVTDAMALRQLLERYGYAGPRFALMLFGTFAASALLLCLIGIYGVFSFATSRRTQEIGVRMALGADRGDVIWMVLRQACGLAALGIAVGLPLAFVAAGFAKSQLFQTSQYDPVTFALVMCTLPLLAVVGTWLPARRAAAVDPMVALRTE